MKPHTLTALLMTFLACQTALTQDRPAQTGNDVTLDDTIAPMLSVRATRFRFLDVDGDGHVSRDEVDEDDTVLRSQFHSLDADGDGRLTETEYVLSHRKQIQ